ncbi:MAG: CHAT domain-containing protein [Saprospiraceae bacterium]|nr:CHAT domain-containing protein [Saprospiraceae bacterium]
MKMNITFFKCIQTICIVFISVGLYSQNSDTILAKSNIDSLIKWSRKLINSQDFEKSLNLLDSAAFIANRILGKDHIYEGKSYFNKGYVFFIMGKYDEAEKLYFRAKEIQENYLGKINGVYANTINNIGIVYYYKQDFDAAEKYYTEAKDIRAKFYGTQSKEYSGSLNNLALLYRTKDDHEKSLEMFLEAKGIWSTVENKLDPGYAHILNNIGLSYAYLGAYEKAEPLFLEAKKIWEITVGKLHPDYALSLSCISFLYLTKSEFEKAEPLYIEVIHIKEKVYGKDHEEYASAVNNLGVLYTKKGDFKRGERLCLEAKDIREKSFGKENNDYAESLINLANLYKLTNKFDLVEPMLVEARAIWAKILGKEHSQYGIATMNLANHFFDIKNFQKAEPLYLEALELRAKVFGKQHESYADVLYNFANMYLETGDLQQAEKLTLEAREIYLKSFGKENANYINSLNHLVSIYQHTDRLEKCASLIFEMDELIRNLVEKAASYSSESQMLAYLPTFKNPVSKILTFIHQHPSHELIQLAYNNALFYNGYLMENAQRISNLATSSDSIFQKNFTDWRGKLRQLSIEYTKPIAQRKRILELEQEAEALEKTLIKSSPEFGETRKLTDWKEVLVQLPNASAAIEFIHFESYGNKDSVIYAALILKKGDPYPRMIPLFSGSELHKSLISEDEIKNQYGLSLSYNRGVTPTKNRTFDHTYHLIWKPIEKNLNGIHKVFYATSGLLHQINLDAIKVDEKTILADDFQLVRLGSTRSLVQNRKADFIKNKEVVLYGGINYNLEPIDQNKRLTEEINFTQVENKLNSTNSGLNADAFKQLWNYLPGTEKETKDIMKLMEHTDFKVKYFSNFAATEESFKQIGKNKASPQILHVATHGFFFSEADKVLDENRMLESAVDSMGRIYKSSELPMMRSGLLLSAANYAWKENRPYSEGMEDGILTAYEISQMNLSNTELVVLSACETGLGDIQGNEGVYGLQRAFKIAGAKYIMMSLWQIPDEETKEFMVRFYANLLSSKSLAGSGNKMSIPEAFRAAQKELRELGFNPYQWAGFILVE